MQRIPFIFFVWFLSLPLAGWTHAQLADAVDPSRVLRQFDFEERQKGNQEDVPMNWTKVEGPDLPHYVAGHLTTDRHRSGNYSFRIDLDGGSCVYRFGSGQIPIKPHAHYQVEGFCQTTALKYARACFTAYFADDTGKPILSTVARSPLFASPDGEAEETWHPLTVQLSCDDPAGAFLVVEMALLQPSQYSHSSLGDRTLFLQDVRGSAWFDDITVSQVPDVQLSTDRPGNVFRKGEPLTLKVRINDLSTSDLGAELFVRDAEDNLVYQRTGPLDATAGEMISAQEKILTVVLPELPAGWYRATLRMTSLKTLLSRKSIDLISLADTSPPLAPDPRFGIVATDLPVEGWTQLPKLMSLLNAGRVKIAIWSGQGDVPQEDSDRFDSVLQSLQSVGVNTTACLLAPPPKMAERLKGKTWQKLLTAAPEAWQPALSYLISRHADHLQSWQLGADGSEDFVTDPEMRRVYKMVFDQFAALVQQPDLAMPWPAWFELDGDMPATVAMSVPASVLPVQIPLYMQEVKPKPGHNLSLTLQPIDRTHYGRMVQIQDFAQRVIYALTADAKRIDLPLPFTVTRKGDRWENEPSEMLMITRTLVTTLRGTTYKGKLPLAEGVEGFLFDRNGEGILALWGNGPQGSVKKLAVNLGERPSQLDLWGNVSPLMREPGNTGKVDVLVGPTPMFLVDIDGPLAQLRASVALDEPLIESSFETHVRKIRFTNPYPQAITGTLRLKGPSGWNFNPGSFNFSMNPEETLEREITIDFPYNSFAGSKTLLAQFTIQTEKTSTFVTPLTMKLGLSDVGMKDIAFRDGPDLVVQQMITNYGEKSINYAAFVAVPGQQRQERLVINLAPAQTTIKKYRFIAAKIAPDARVRAGIKEIEGSRVLNELVEIR